MVLDCSTLTSRGSLFAVILLLLSDDPDGFGCLALLSSALSPSIATSPSMCSSLLARAASLVLVPWSVLVVALGRTTDADDLPYETRGCGVGSCCVQRNSLLRFRLVLTDNTGPLQYASHSQLGRVSFNCISQCTIDRPSAGLQSSSDMLRCELAAVPDKFSDSGIQGNLH